MSLLFTHQSSGFAELVWEDIFGADTASGLQLFAGFDTKVFDETTVFETYAANDHSADPLATWLIDNYSTQALLLNVQFYRDDNSDQALPWAACIEQNGAS